MSKYKLTHTSMDGSKTVIYGGALKLILLFPACFTDEKIEIIRVEA